MKLIPLDAVLEILTKVSPRSHIPNVIDAVMEITTIDPIATIDEMITSMLSKAEEHKENKRLDLARNTLDIVYAFKELKSRLLLTQK